LVKGAEKGSPSVFICRVTDQRRKYELSLRRNRSLGLKESSSKQIALRVLLH